MLLRCAGNEFWWFWEEKQIYPAYQFSCCIGNANNGNRYSGEYIAYCCDNDTYNPQHNHAPTMYKEPQEKMYGCCHQYTQPYLPPMPPGDKRASNTKHQKEQSGNWKIDHLYLLWGNSSLGEFLSNFLVCVNTKKASIIAYQKHKWIHKEFPTEDNSYDKYNSNQNQPQTTLLFVIELQYFFHVVLI